ncbi:hypothetical protein HDV05_008212 [Chytridiales sp. JEL 0842]|nr:hypothetical protein HDV05_008212 [Chytridiales sp. JEL 0842]
MSSYVQYMKLDPNTLENIKSQGAARIRKLKPLSEFFDRNRFSKPANTAMFSARLTANLSYFQSNYLLFALLAVTYSLITNLWLLFVVVFVGVGYRIVSAVPPNEPLSLFGGKVVMSQSQAWVALGCTSFLLLWFTAAGSAILWIVSVTATLIILHAGFMDTPIETDFAGGEV